MMLFTKKRKINTQSGAAMIISVIFFLFISLAIISGIVSPVIRGFNDANTNLKSKQAYYLAESGAEDIAYRAITNNPASGSPWTSLPVWPYSSPALAINGNSVNFTGTNISSTSGGSIITSATISGLLRKITISLTTGQTPFSYSAMVGAGGIYLQSGGNFTGDVYSQGSVYCQNSGSFNGNLYSNSSISGNCWVAGVKTQNGSNVRNSYPISSSDISQWKTDVLSQTSANTTGPLYLNGNSYSFSNGGQVHGDVSFSNGGSLSFNGPGVITGNLNLANGSSVTFSNILYIKGNITGSNSGSIYTNSNYGVVVVDGSVSLGNNIPITGADGKLLLVILGSGTAFSPQNSVTTNLVYVPNGKIDLVSGGNLNNVIGAYGISMENGGTVSMVSNSAGITSSTYYHYSSYSTTFVLGGWGESQ